MQNEAVQVCRKGLESQVEPVEQRGELNSSLLLMFDQSQNDATRKPLFFTKFLIKS